MIRYKSDLFGLRTLFMWNGSAAFRAVMPASISTGLVVVYYYFWKDLMKGLVEDSYTIAVMIGFFGFLLTTRLNFSYSRWWEAVSMCHQMTSKLTDSALCLAAYHYQSAIWDPIKPDTFGDAYAGHKIERPKPPTTGTTGFGDVSKLDANNLTVSSTASEPPYTAFNFGPVKDEVGLMQWVQEFFSPPTVEVPTPVVTEPPRHRHVRSLSVPMLFTKSFLPNDHKERHSVSSLVVPSQRSISDFAPSDFLDEMVHLYSLLNAVAMASLRSDVEGCPSPLAEYIPNRPFPPYNSDNFKRRDGHLRRISINGDGRTSSSTWWDKQVDKFWNLFYFLVGINRSAKQRTLYNAARPFLVLGGVSEAEAHRLQQARGPSAQVALCQLWLKEFIAREYLHGSTGKVEPPIITRVFGFLADASLAYHQCSKIAFVPFPFPHEQMTVLFTIIVLVCYPVLSVAYVNDLTLGCLLNFATILCFQGIYEVARELTNPYYTVPNDLPLNRFHVEFNESLRSLLMGYHPDAKKS